MIWWIFVITVAIFWYMKSKRNNQGLKELPGPKGLPLVGNMFQLGNKQWQVMMKWSDEFGSIYKFNAGPQMSVVISDPKIAKEMFLNDPNYIGRVHMTGFEIYENQQLGILSTEGEVWEVHRRFLLRQLRDFGFGKSAMQSLILEELDEITETFKAAGGKPIQDIKRVVTLGVINSLWSVLACTRFKHDDPKLLAMIDNLQKITVDLNENQKFLFLVMLLPWVRHVIPELCGYNMLRRFLDGNKAFFENAVKDHKKNFQEDNIRDFIDVYLAEVKKTTDPNSVFYGDFAERQLTASMFDLFVAGSETTSTTLAFAILYIIKFEGVQKKFQAEISAVTNDSRNVSVDDRPNMPYTIAMIDEVLRMSSIVPAGVPHRALENKEFQGYFIPKNTLIIPNLRHMHFNEKVWGDPKVFRPERFLSKDEKKYQKHEYLMPFQIGRRQCVGETLARDTVFLYLTNLFQRFTFSFDPDSPEPTLEERSNFTPHPYSVIVKDRLSS